jgi:hypothetical protein
VRGLTFAVAARATKGRQGTGGPQKGHEKTTAKDSKGWVPELGRHRARQGQHSPEIADEIAPLIYGAGFSGTSTRLQWIAHQDPVGHTRSFDAARTRPQSASFAGAPIKPRERRHVTQPRAGINVSCSRAGHKGATEGRENLKKRTAKGIALKSQIESPP